MENEQPRGTAETLGAAVNAARSQSDSSLPSKPVPAVVTPQAVTQVETQSTVTADGTDPIMPVPQLEQANKELPSFGYDLGTTNSKDHHANAGSAKKRLGKRAILGVLIASLFMLAVIAASYMYFTSAYTVRTLTNSGYAYSFIFNRGATIQSINGTNYMHGWSVPAYKKIDVLADRLLTLPPAACSHLGASWSQTTEVTIYGKQYPVCSQNKEVYEAIFMLNGSSHFIEVISHSPITSDIPLKIIKSISVTPQ